MDNTSALCYLVKKGGTQNKMMFELAKEIWSYLLTYNIMITVEYLPSKLNVVADWESRNCRDSSEWKLSPRVFTLIWQKWGTPDVDLFASRLSHQVPGYMAWKPDPGSRATDALKQNWKNLFPYAFPSIHSHRPGFNKSEKGKSTVNSGYSTLASSAWYATLLQMSIKDPLFLPQYKDLLKNPSGQIHPLVTNKSLQLGAWMVSGNIWQQKEYQSRLQTLYKTVGEQEKRLLTNRPGISCLAGVINKKLIHFNVL